MKLWVLIILLIGGQRSFAAAEERMAPKPQFNNFYTVKDPTIHSNPNQLPETVSWEVLTLLWQQLEELRAQGGRFFSLLVFENHQGMYGNVVEPYNRLKHFGTWRRGEDCLNTRADVLIRDSTEPVTFNASGCTVLQGRWPDPYTGQDFLQASQIQIDHFVPLKNAYISGADTWSSQKRCLYANYTGNDFHLLAVSGQENSRKSDSSPVKYVPPHRPYTCQYLSQWLKVKLIWSLALTPPEKEIVSKLVAEHQCDVSHLIYGQDELEEQRRRIDENVELCH